MELEKREKCFGGNWKLTESLGAGSYGKVYKAARVDFGKTYSAAVKVITIPHSTSEIDSAYSEGMTGVEVTDYFRKYVEQLVDEFEIMSSLKGCSNIVNYEDHEVIPHEDGIGWDIYIRMELLTPLTKKIIAGMTTADVLRLGIDICKALELCRVKNLIHRDIKPENIFVSDFGDYKLGDFGIARTLDGTSGGLSKKGTYSFMAPEVYLEKPYGATIDIYSLGIVLYRLLNANRTPFLPPYPQPITHTDREAAIQMQMRGETPIPAPARASAALSEIVLRACAYDPKDRYQTPTEMRQALETLQRQCSEEELRRVVLEPNPDKVGKEHETVPFPGRSKDPEPPEPTLEQPKEEPDDPGEPGNKLSALLKQKKFIGIAAAVVVALLALVIILIAGSSKKDTAPEKERVADTPAPPVVETTQTPVYEWMETFPEEAFLSGAQIETELRYRSSPLRIHDTEDPAFGELCYTQEGIPGEWGEWQTEEIEATDTVEVEEKTVYFSRRLVAYKRGNAYHSATWTEYGWSGWTESDEEVQAVRGSVEVRTEQRYRSRPLESRYYYAENWSEWDSVRPASDENTIVQVRQRFRQTGEAAVSGTASMDNFGVNGAVETVFSDVPEGKWYSDAVRAVANAGILTSDAFLRFEPDKDVTLGKVVYAADMVSRCYNGETLLQITDETLYPIFLRDAVQRGIVAEGQIKTPDAPATRSQVAEILYHALPDEAFGKINEVHLITDMVEGTETYTCVKRLAEAGVFTWQSPEGAFSPELGVTGAQLASVIYRAIYPAGTEN